MDILQFFEKDYDKKVFKRLIICFLHIGQIFKSPFTAQFSHVIKCPHGMNTKEIWFSIQILHKRSSSKFLAWSSRYFVWASRLLFLFSKFWFWTVSVWIWSSWFWFCILRSSYFLINVSVKPKASLCFWFSCSMFSRYSRTSVGIFFSFFWLENPVILIVD